MRSTWNEDLYTTKLDKSKSRITMEEANRLAAEIEAAARSGRTSNHHLVEERGIAVGGADEARAAPEFVEHHKGGEVVAQSALWACQPGSRKQSGLYLVREHRLAADGDDDACDVPSSVV